MPRQCSCCTAMAWEEWRDDGGGSGSWAATIWEPTGCSWSAGGSWERSGPRLEAELHRQPWSGYRRREPGNGYRPKANDPAGWDHGENKPSTSELEYMLYYGPAGAGKPLRLKFKAYTHREGQKMGIEDALSGLRAVAEREKAAKDAAELMHQAELESQAEAMEREFSYAIARSKTIEVIVEKQVVVEKEVYRDVFVEVEVLHEGAERPPPLFKGGQSVHQWWASLHPESKANMDGRHGSVHRSFRGNNSVSKHAAMPECQE